MTATRSATARQGDPRTPGGRGRARRLATALGLTAAATLSVLAAAPAQAGSVTTPCATAVHVDSAWGGTQSWAGTVVTVTVTNTAASASGTWIATAATAAGQSVGSIWNARSIGSGSSLVAANDAGNGTLAPGASTTFGVYLQGGSQAPSFTCVSDAPRPSGTTTLTEADNGKTVTVVLGDTVTVQLGKDWQPTTLTGDWLQLVSVTGGYPTGAPLQAVYRTTWGTSSSTTVLRSQTDYDCFHTPPYCARPTQLWSVTVRVAVPPPSAP